jgi:hypothetical protein
MSQVRRRPGAIEIRPFGYLRLLGWIGLIIAPLSGMAAVALIAQGDGLGVMLIATAAAGYVMNRMGWMYVLVEPKGISRRIVGTRFYARDAIEALSIKPVQGIGGSRAEIEIHLKDGSRVPLDATLIVRSGPEHTELKHQIIEMRSLLSV